MNATKATRMEEEAPRGTTPGKLLDFKFGYALLMDRRVPLYSKVVAFVIGILGIAILGVLELPVEEIVAAIPVLGILGDLALDGVEVVLGPVVIACGVLPYLAPAGIVARVRRERDPAAARAGGPIIDV